MEILLIAKKSFATASTLGGAASLRLGSLSPEDALQPPGEVRIVTALQHTGRCRRRHVAFNLLPIVETRTEQRLHFRLSSAIRTVGRVSFARSAFSEVDGTRPLDVLPDKGLALQARYLFGVPAAFPLRLRVPRADRENPTMHE